MKMTSDARTFAIAAHGKQQYGNHPYVVHLDAVAAIAAAYGEMAQTVAYLHDVVEDTPITLEEVRTHFGELVAGCVALLTDEAGATRKERKAKTYAKLAKVYGSLQLALIVKAADRLANVQACIADNKQDLLAVYRAEHVIFRPAAYRPGLCDEIWQQLDQLLAE
jgi:(p)ppGpp synthase/HD superfamily hydrolase